MGIKSNKSKLKKFQNLARAASVSLVAIAAAMAGYAAQSNAAGVTVDWNVRYQTIDGFGASDAFVNVALTDVQADMFFSETTGIGLSFLRMGIANSGGLNGGAYSDATKAAARGARVWAAAWTAPAAWKDNGSTSNGGHLCAGPGQGVCTATHYNDWATRLAGFAATLKLNSGVDLYALSVQNEPDFVASYDSMIVSDGEFVSFVNTLAPKLAALAPRPKLMVGEHANWSLLWSMATVIEANPTALAATDIYGTHQYFGVSPYQAPRPKPLWQTEMSSFDAFDASIGNAVTVGKWIHDALTVGNVNVWHYWWLQNPYNETNEGLRLPKPIECQLCDCCCQQFRGRSAICRESFPRSHRRCHALGDIGLIGPCHAKPHRRQRRTVQCDRTVWCDNVCRCQRVDLHQRFRIGAANHVSPRQPQLP